MPAYDFSLNKAGLAQAAAPPGAANAVGSGGGFSFETAFHDLFEIVNPLQHLPVVGTLYRAVTHDTMGPVEKLAGDTLYGGLWGAVGSLADLAFEKITGKDFGATMLALVTGDGGKPVTVAAAAAPTPVRTPAAQAPQDASRQQGGADVAALATSLSAKGVDGSLSARALFAYRQSLDLAAAPVSLLAAN